jgi:hypothetical protein
MPDEVRVKLFDTRSGRLSKKKHRVDNPSASAEGNLRHFGVTLGAMKAIRQTLAKPMGAEVGKMIMRYTQQAIVSNFAEQRDSFGRQWDELDEDWTVPERSAGGYGADEPILIRSRTLFDQATRNLSMRLSDRSTKMTLTPVVTGNPVKWMHNRPVHQPITITQEINKGSHSWKREITIPGREFFFMRNEDSGIIGEALAGLAIHKATRIAKSRRFDEGSLKASAYELSMLNEDLIRGANRYSGRSAWMGGGSGAGSIQ